MADEGDEERWRQKYVYDLRWHELWRDGWYRRLDVLSGDVYVRRHQRMRECERDDYGNSPTNSLAKP